MQPIMAWGRYTTILTHLTISLSEHLMLHESQTTFPQYMHCLTFPGWLFHILSSSDIQFILPFTLSAYALLSNSLKYLKPLEEKFHKLPTSHLPTDQTLSPFSGPLPFPPVIYLGTIYIKGG